MTSEFRKRIYRLLKEQINEVDSKIVGINEYYEYENDHEYLELNDLNDNFWKWFGNSKAVNNQGKPLVLYHGTGFSFNVFNTPKKGIFLSDNKEVAQFFAFYSRAYDREIKRVYARIENPLIVDAKGHLYGDIDFNGEKYSAEGLSVYAQAKGYDGLIIKNIKEAGEWEVLSNDYIVFKSNQIKSVDNNGNWSTISDNIYE